MSKAPSPESATMIVPRGTVIEVDARGQLSISTPGNLVLQNSGSFGSLESVNGSIRIEHDVEIEAASVRCAEACYIQGSLTAWKVTARTLHLEDTAQAHIVLQETEGLEVGRGARLVGNFSSEDELFLLFSRFAEQVRGLPIATSRRRRPRSVAGEGEVVRALAGSGDAGPREPGPGQPGEPTGPAEGAGAAGSAQGAAGNGLPDALAFARTLLSRELEQDELSDGPARVVRELVKLLDEGDLETLRHTYRALFAKVDDPPDGVKKAAWLVKEHFG